MAEPVSLELLKTHLRIDQSGTGDADEDQRQDDWLSGLITAARRTCEKYTGRILTSKSCVLAIDGFPRAPGYADIDFADYCLQPDRAAFEVITLPAGTVSSIDAVAYRDDVGATIALDPADWGSDLINDPARIYPADAWPLAPALPGSVRISYTVSPVDADDVEVVALVIMLAVGNWYRNREASQVDARGAPAEIPLTKSWLLDPLVDYGRS